MIINKLFAAMISLLFLNSCVPVPKGAQTVYPFNKWILVHDTTIPEDIKKDYHGIAQNPGYNITSLIRVEYIRK